MGLFSRLKGLYRDIKAHLADSIYLYNGANLELLKRNGLRVGENVHFGGNCFIDPWHCFLISIGNNCTFSEKVHILAHDASTKRRTGYTKIGLVEIGDNVFVGANATILPNVKIGDNAIIGAGAVVTRSVPANEIWAGVPARFICGADSYFKKLESAGKDRYFNESYIIGELTEDKKREMLEKLKDGVGFIR